MVKGVNKTIIEINNTGNSYFERAILFIDPEYCCFSEKRIKNEALKYLNGVNKDYPTGLRQRRLNRKKRKRQIIVLSSIGAAAVSILLLILL